MPSQFTQRQNDALRWFKAGEKCLDFVPGTRGVLQPSGRKIQYATIEALAKQRKIIKLGPRLMATWQIARPGDWEQRDAELEERKRQLQEARDAEDKAIREDRHARWTAAIISRLAWDIRRLPNVAADDPGEVAIEPGPEFGAVLDAIMREVALGGTVFEANRIPPILSAENLPGLPLRDPPPPKRARGGKPKRIIGGVSYDPPTEGELNEAYEQAQDRESDEGLTDPPE